MSHFFHIFVTTINDKHHSQYQLEFGYFILSWKPTKLEFMIPNSIEHFQKAATKMFCFSTNNLNAALHYTNLQPNTGYTNTDMHADSIQLLCQEHRSRQANTTAQHAVLNGNQPNKLTVLARNMFWPFALQNIHTHMLVRVQYYRTEQYQNHHKNIKSMVIAYVVTEKPLKVECWYKSAIKMCRIFTVNCKSMFLTKTIQMVFNNWNEQLNKIKYKWKTSQTFTAFNT